jgi:hypothetical protein
LWQSQRRHALLNCGPHCRIVDHPRNVRHIHNRFHHASRHSRGNAKRLLDAAEIVPDEIERRRVAMIFEFLAERIIRFTVVMNGLEIASLGVMSGIAEIDGERHLFAVLSFKQEPSAANASPPPS